MDFFVFTSFRCCFNARIVRSSVRWLIKQIAIKKMAPGRVMASDLLSCNLFDSSPATSRAGPHYFHFCLYHQSIRLSVEPNKPNNNHDEQAIRNLRTLLCLSSTPICWSLPFVGRSTPKIERLVTAKTPTRRPRPPHHFGPPIPSQNRWNRSEVGRPATKNTACFEYLVVCCDGW